VEQLDTALGIQTGITITMIIAGKFRRQPLLIKPILSVNTSVVRNQANHSTKSQGLTQLLWSVPRTPSPVQIILYLKTLTAIHQNY
jgi:hypothetical protein